MEGLAPNLKGRSRASPENCVPKLELGNEREKAGGAALSRPTELRSYGAINPTNVITERKFSPLEFLIFTAIFYSHSTCIKSLGFCSVQFIPALN